MGRWRRAGVPPSPGRPRRRRRDVARPRGRAPVISRSTRAFLVKLHPRGSFMMTNPSAMVPRRDSKVGRPPLPTATHTPPIKHWLRSSEIHETLPEEFSCDAKRWGGGAGPGCRRRPDGPGGPGATSHDGKGALRVISRSTRAFLMKLRPLGFFMMTNPSAMVPRRDSKVDRPAVPTPTHTPPI